MSPSLFLIQARPYYRGVNVNAGEPPFFKKHLPPHKTTPKNTNLLQRVQKSPAVFVRIYKIFSDVLTDARKSCIIVLVK